MPTEFLVYPGTKHGIPNARNQPVKMRADFNWVEKVIRGKEGWFEQKQLPQTLKGEEPEKGSARSSPR